MKRRFSIGPAVVTVIVELAVPAFLAAQQPYRDLPVFKRRPAQAQPHKAHTAEPPGFPASASGNIVPTQCPPDALALDPSVSCGFVPVPLERNHPAEETINIYFELYPHTNAGPAESAIVPNLGGPGPSTTANRSGWLGFFAPNLDAHDLLLIDDRGRGLSGTIGITNCTALQHGTVTSFDKVLAECAAELGDDNSHYGTGDIAQDVEAVRAALGYDKLDYHGGSYGGVDAIAYATRYGEHLRSLVFDSGAGPPALASFGFEHYEAVATSREVRVSCLRSPACSADHPNPDREWQKLIRTVRHHPVDGMAYDADGNLKAVHFDEPVLLSLASQYPSGGYIAAGEFLAAGRALEHGDTAPLLRLGAEGYFVFGDSGDPTLYSAGAGNATAASDYHVPFEWSVPPAKRLKQLKEAVADLPTDYFFPFSRAASTSLENTQGFARGLVFWEEASPPAPVIPIGATYPGVPVLAMASDIEAVVPTEQVVRVAALFPSATFVSIAGGLHESALSGNHCAWNLDTTFIETLGIGDTSCAATPETIWPAVGRFPLVADDARPADVNPAGHNEIGEAERKVATVAVAAATDTAQRLNLSSTGNGVGLRGGTFQTTFTPTSAIITLTNCAFAADVIVNGTVVWSNTFVADLTVSGTGTAGGNLHIEGTWQAPGPVGNFKVRGTLGGQQVAVLVPEA